MEEVCDLNFEEKGIMAISYEDEQYGGYILEVYCGCWGMTRWMLTRLE